MIFNIPSVDLTTIVGLDSLIRAIERASYSGVSDVLESNPTLVDYVDARGHTPLHWVCAMIGNHVDIAELLLARGADIAAKDNEGWTPSDWADFMTNMGIVEMLVDDF